MYRFIVFEIGVRSIMLLIWSYCLHLDLVMPTNIPIVRCYQIQLVEKYAKLSAIVWIREKT